MPTRVLEIIKRPGRGDYQLRLKETRELKSEPYAALSYCWGGPQSITTTKESYRRHSLMINPQALPASVRDAVIVAESIGIRYLWIDAFCILQDDQTDLNWEMVQMPMIYSEATMTIVASRARGVSDGFLHERPRMGADTPDQVFKLAFHCSDNRRGSVVLIPNIESSTEPLDLRAWALQERLLSPRIVEYGSLQTRWICQTLSRCSSLTDGFKNISVFNKERSDALFIRALQIILATSESITDNRRRDLLDCWDDMLKVYTHRALSCGTDRLPAISGIAAHFGKSLRNEYKAGLWRSDIESQLLWKRLSLSYPKMNLKIRPLEYQGPSWSWAAINEPIELKSGTRNRDSHVGFEVVDYDIKTPLASANFSVCDPSFGAVKSASLVLRGRLGAGECTYTKRTSDPELDLWFFTKKHDSGLEEDLCASFHLDALEVEFANRDSGSMPVFLIQVSGPIPEGLILRHIEGSNFSRLGVFAFYKPGHRSPGEKQIKWLNDCPTQTITLI